MLFEWTCAHWEASLVVAPLSLPTHIARISSRRQHTYYNRFSICMSAPDVAAIPFEILRGAYWKKKSRKPPTHFINFFFVNGPSPTFLFFCLQSAPPEELKLNGPY